LLRALSDQLLHTGYLRGNGQEATAAQDLEFSKIGFSICVQRFRYNKGLQVRFSRSHIDLANQYD